MDTHTISSVEGPKAPPPKPRSSSSSQASPAPEPKPSGDTVDLSPKAKDLAQTSKSTQTSLNSEQRKFSVTDNNDVILQVIDPDTQKVVKSIPSEEAVQLKNAIRDGINDITE